MEDRVVYQGEEQGERVVTGSRDLAEALRSTEAGFREFIDRCPDAVFVRRGTEIIHVNAALLEVLGMERHEVIGKDPAVAFTHPLHRASVLEHRVKQPDDTDLRECRWVRKDGETVDMEVVGVTVMFEGLPARVCMCRDLTEKKRVQARLLMSGRMASVGTLASGIAHEINNPLSALISNLRLIAKDPRAAFADPVELKAMLDDMLQGAERVRRIVESLRTFSRSDDARRERLELPRVIDAALELCASELKQRARLVKELGEVGRVEANEARLVQAIVDLLVNAAHAIPAGRPDQNEIRVGLSTDARGQAVITVRDTGVGISPEQLTRIFDPFFTTKGTCTGAGLGLSTCHSIVSSLGGEVRVESKVGRGTTFTVTLPVVGPGRG
jgi:PAS domain S-box-containing protein